jgi:hypothetical protein
VKIADVIQYLIVIKPVFHNYKVSNSPSSPSALRCKLFRVYNLFFFIFIREKASGVFSLQQQAT